MSEPPVYLPDADVFITAKNTYYALFPTVLDGRKASLTDGVETA